jgi:tyrosinase
MCNQRTIQKVCPLSSTYYVFFNSNAFVPSMSVNLGPISPSQDGVTKSSSTFAYNPRCLKRDIATKASSTWLKISDITSLITASPDIATFQNTMQGDFPAGFLGVHAAGHFTMNGDPGGDLFASPGDPAFWLHHGMVDRTWWIWQLKNLPASLTAVAGTLTIFNNPPSANTTLSDVQNFGPLAQGIELGSLLSTVSGPFCYIYL